jgi:hypothetical protein
MLRMSEPRETWQNLTQHRAIGRSTPRSFSKTSWWRFRQDRSRSYLDRLPAPPSTEDGARIEALVNLEWSALRAEAVARDTIGKECLVAAREGREHRRLMRQLLWDFERSIERAQKPASTERSLANIIAGMVR